MYARLLPASHIQMTEKQDDYNHRFLYFKRKKKKRIDKKGIDINCGRLQLLAKLRRVLRGSERAGEALEGRDGGVDLKNSRSYGLRRVLLAVNEVPPTHRQPPGFEILETHLSFVVD